MVRVMRPLFLLSKLHEDSFRHVEDTRAGCARSES